MQANLRLAADKESALRTVDELRRQSKKQEDSYDALVSRGKRFLSKQGVFFFSCSFNVKFATIAYPYRR